jgi:hypothetical protein
MKIAPATLPRSYFAEFAFLRPSSEIKIDTTPKRKANAYGTQIAENNCGFSVFRPFQAAMIDPVIAAKFVRDWTVRKSLTAGFSEFPPEPSKGETTLVVVLNKFANAM